MPTISGTVYDSSGAAAAGRTVRAYRRDTGALLGEATTNSAGTLTYADEVTADAPVLWFRMQETSGTTAANAGSAGSGGDGTYSGGCTLNQTGFVSSGKSVLFGGSASAGRITSAHTTTYTSACTLMAWINPNSTGQATSDLAYIISKDLNNAAATSTFPISLVWRAATTKLEFRLSKGDDYNPDLILASGTLSPGTSYLVHAVYRSSGLCELYVNGVQVDSSTVAWSISDSGSVPWSIGCATPNVVPASDIAFAGRIGEAAVFSTALSAARIARHYSGECNVIALDDAAGSVEDDLIIRTTGV
jgi:hypothetical protein